MQVLWLRTYGAPYPYTPVVFDAPREPLVVVLVDSTAHAGELLQRLPGWSMIDAKPRDRKMSQPAPDAPGYIVTLTAADKYGLRADVLVRATGGTGRLDLDGFPRWRWDEEDPDANVGVKAAHSPDEGTLGMPPSGCGRDVERLRLKDELSLREAVRVLTCDPKTVIRYIEEGLLEWRNAASASSSRPLDTISLDSVTRLRTTYRKGHKEKEPPRSRHRRRTQPHLDSLRHITLDEP